MSASSVAPQNSATKNLRVRVVLIISLIYLIKAVFLLTVSDLGVVLLAQTDLRALGKRLTRTGRPVCQLAVLKASVFNTNHILLSIIYSSVYLVEALQA